MIKVKLLLVPLIFLFCFFTLSSPSFAFLFSSTVSLKDAVKSGQVDAWGKSPGGYSRLELTLPMQ